MIKVAAAQLAPKFLDLDAGVRKACDAIAEAGRNGAQLIAFPETFLPGYPYWLLVHDVIDNVEYNRELYRQSVQLGGLDMVRLGKAAKAAGCIVVIGVSERVGGTLFNSQWTFDEKGCLIGHRRKLVPTAHERMVWGQGSGPDLSVWQTSIATIGGLICYEHSNALFRYALQAQGEQIHIANWPGGLRINQIIDAATRHYAFEGQCFVVNVTAVVDDMVLARLGKAKNLAALVSPGGYSSIIAPNARYLAGPATGGEEIIYAELDFDRIIDQKMVVDTAGHYARPDIVRLCLDRAAPTVLQLKDADAD